MNYQTGIAIKFVLLNLLIVFVAGDVGVRCLKRERDALVRFKNGLIDDYGILWSWQTEECCKWYGVVCSNTTGHVISLLLDGDAYPGAKLRGKISSSLLELQSLYALDLSYNDFGGDQIPQFIGSMKQLQYLYLSYSNFSGTFPPQIGNLTNLVKLSLSYNSLGCKNLDWLSNLSFLVYLDLSYSFDLSRTNWQQHITSLPSLQAVYLNYCNISSYVKPSADLFVNSSSLAYLGLSQNKLTSSAFQWLPNISRSLIELDLSNNALSGQIPDGYERLMFLKLLDLSSNRLEGEIPKSFGNLSALQFLILYNNSLSGRIDNELFGNVSTKGIWSSLKILDLAANRFNGSVPDLRPFSALTEVYLGKNQLMGPMPLSLGQLPKLNVLEVSHNKLEGNVSESHLINLVSLKVLDISFNELILDTAPDWIPPFQLKDLNLAGGKMGSRVPKWIQTQKNVSKLDLSETGIAGQLPKWIWSFSPSLESLFLSQNQITGTLPDDLSSTSIINLDVSSNRLSGSIPLFHPKSQSFDVSQNMLSGSISSICNNLRNTLWFLDLSYNQFSGEIPNCWDKMPYLFFLNLGSNFFSGEIPVSLGFLKYLNILQLHDNNLSGELPHTLVLCQHLQVIDVGGNDLTGTFPSLEGHRNLSLINLRNNRFYGSISPGICNLKELKVMDFSGNNLSGKIPDCFNNFTSLAEKMVKTWFAGFVYTEKYNPWLPNLNMVKRYNQYSIVNWKDHDSASMQHLPYLKLIDFSRNGLTGGIPESFSNMKGLCSLNLSRNCFTGPIIPGIGKMELLESLDLSNNQLSGNIPTGLAELSFLSVLDLSNNNLSGKIPSSSQLQGFNVSCFAGNNELCGPPLEMCPENGRRPSTPTHGKKYSLSFIQEVGISMGFGGIVGFWGVVGSLVLKNSWRYAYFNFLDAAADWLYVTTTVFLSKWRPN